MNREPRALTNRSFDVLVIGGGIHGACAARDAALRGLRVALVERGDFGCQTSHNSLKIVHGGLRYLQHLDLVRTRQSVRERRFWLRQAAHLVRPLPCLMPLQGYGTRGPAALWAGLLMHDIAGWDRNRSLATDRRIPRGRVISSRALRHEVPALEAIDATGAAIWSDAQMVDSDRLLLICVEDAVAHGTVACNYLRARKLLARSDRIVGIEAVDEINGDELEIHATMIINAAGPWAGELLESDLGNNWSKRLPQTKNMNVVVKGVLSDYALGVKSDRQSDSVLDAGNRLFFVTPWRGVSIIGTAHAGFSGHADSYRVEEAEIRGFLEEFNAACPAAALDMSDVHYCHRGLIPSAGGSSVREARVSRHGTVIDHGAEDGIGNLVSIVGVKYTTARLLAEHAVDAVLRGAGRAAPRSRSDEMPLPGSDGYESERVLGAALESELGEAAGIEGGYFLETFGTLFRDALQIGDWSAGDGDEAFFRCRVRNAVRREMASRLSDVVLRRTDRTARGKLVESDLCWAADFMAAELGWTPGRRQDELDRARVEISRCWGRVTQGPR